MAIKIEPWAGLSAQTYGDGKGKHIIANLILKAKDLPVQEMPLEHLNIYNIGFDSDSIRKFVSHMKSIMNADLDYPIILDEDGYVMDGRHRIAKALFEGKETIKFVRFENTPDPDYLQVDDEK